MACREPSWWLSPHDRKTDGHAFAAEYGGTWYADYRELLAQAQADVVTICTPHDLHAPMTLAAAQAGVHVLCEKPMARNVSRMRCDDRRV